MGLFNRHGKVVIKRSSQDVGKIKTSKGMPAADEIAILLCALAKICMEVAKQESVPLEKLQRGVHTWFDEYIKEQMSKEEQ